MDSSGLTNIKVLFDGHRWHIKEPLRRGRNYVPAKRGWTFDGNVESPTFKPSILESWSSPDGIKHVNHFVITDGIINYQPDCTHALAGQSHPLDSFSEAEVKLHQSLG